MLFFFFSILNIYFYNYLLFLNDEFVIAINLILTYIFLYYMLKNISLKNFFFSFDIIYYNIYIYLYLVKFLNFCKKEYIKVFIINIINSLKNKIRILFFVYKKYINILEFIKLKKNIFINIYYTIYILYKYIYKYLLLNKKFDNYITFFKNKKNIIL